MSEKSDLNPKDFIAFSTEELLEKAWPACNLATLVSVAETLPLMITDIRTGQRCTLAELRKHYKAITMSDHPGLGEFSFIRDALIRHPDIEAFEAEYPELAKMLRGEEPDVLKIVVGKSKDRAGGSPEPRGCSREKQNFTKQESSKRRFPQRIVNQCREVARKLKPLENKLTYREVLNHPTMLALFEGKEPPQLDTFKKWMKRVDPVRFNTHPGKRARKPQDSVEE